MKHEEISDGIGGISDQYIQEAAAYSVSSGKAHVRKRPLVSRHAGHNLWRKNKLWLKTGIAAACVLLFTVVAFPFFMENPVEDGQNDNTAYKPAIMFEDHLYLNSSKNPDLYEIDEDELTCVGRIEDTIAGTNLPFENFQASGNSAIFSCNIYRTDRYPGEIFVFDNSGNLFVYDLDDDTSD